VDAVAVHTRDLVVVAASAGGVESLRRLASVLPADLPATVLVVLHFPSGGYSVLPSILSRAGPLPARHAVDGEPLRPGHVVVAPVDHHLLVADGCVRLSRGPRENGNRPAADPLFRSVARGFGPRVVGIVLSGALDDGTAGLLAIAGRGGVTVVQDPEDAMYPGMPRSALDHLDVDHVLPVDDMGSLLDRICRETVDMTTAPEPDPLLGLETAIAGLEPEALRAIDRPGSPAGLGCPDCHGSLFEMREQGVAHFRCRVGHAWSGESLAAEQADALESALWTALRVLQDRAALCSKLADGASRRGQPLTAQRYADELEQGRRAADVLREMLDRALGRGVGRP
jgi:two-component system chemotaxis response regulator CheB